MGLVNLALRGSQFLWALLVLALAGNMVDLQFHSQAIVNYTLFCAVFAMFTLLFLIPASIKEGLAFHPFLPFTLDLLNTLFWFCGAVALPAYIGVHSCGNQAYLDSNSITSNAADEAKHCHEAQANTAFLWFGWASFMGSLIITGMGLSGGSVRRTGGIRRGPAMSQV